MRQLLAPAEFDALINYGLESAEIEGDTATGTYGEPPKEIEDQPNVGRGAQVKLRRAGDRWLITSLPGD